MHQGQVAVEKPGVGGQEGQHHHGQPGVPQAEDDEADHAHGQGKGHVDQVAAQQVQQLARVRGDLVDDLAAQGAVEEAHVQAVQLLEDRGAQLGHHVLDDARRAHAAEKVERLQAQGVGQVQAAEDPKPSQGGFRKDVVEVDLDRVGREDAGQEVGGIDEEPAPDARTVGAEEGPEGNEDPEAGGGLFLHGREIVRAASRAVQPGRPADGASLKGGRRRLTSAGKTRPAVGKPGRASFPPPTLTSTRRT